MSQPSIGSASKYRWGILGTGFAADQFVSSLGSLPNADVAMVASQSLDRAQWFAKQHGVSEAVGGYESLIHSDQIDIVYVATVAPLHHPLCMAAIEAGKPVLCEKPFAMNATEAAEIASAAERSRVFCMEAMWSRFIPMMERVRHTIDQGVIGDVVWVASDFGLRQTPQSNPRLFHPENGGALRDLGVYPISLAVQYLGLPDSVDIVLARDDSGVDVRASGVLGYRNGTSASLLADITCQTPTTATIIGTSGFIEIDSPMYRPTRAKLYRSSPPPSATTGAKRSGRIRRVVSAMKRRLMPDGQTMTAGYRSNGYHYQAAEVMRCLDRRLIESPIMPLSESVDILKVIDIAMATPTETMS